MKVEEVINYPKWIADKSCCIYIFFNQRNLQNGSLL
jgi:hypothetical protein